MPQAFSGIRVYDATQGVAGPYGTMLLALHGADVIKVEPLEGDWCRILGRTVGDHGAHSVVFNRAKRSIAFDLKHHDGREIARRLLANADVVTESFRPGVMARLGLDYATLRAAKPAIVYASLSGFGQTGPRNGQPAVDAIIQAYSGMMVMNRTPDGMPHRQGMIAVDVIAGLYLFQALSAAIMRQVRFGEGSFIDASLMQAAAAFQTAKIVEHHLEAGAPQPLYVPSGLFSAADRNIVISVMRDDHFRTLCALLGRPELAQDPRFAGKDRRTENGAALLAALRPEFAKRQAAHWIAALQGAGIMAEHVMSYGDWLADPHVAAAGGVDWVEHSGIGRIPLARIPGLPLGDDDTAAHHAPHLGEHSRDILEGLGYPAAEIERLVAAGIVREAAR